MKRAGNLFEKICSWENLELAAKKARKRKRLRIYSENFELKRETILSGIRAKLLDGTWRSQKYRTFKIYDPKERLICAPEYVDRIVHHALCNVIGPIIERSMIFHSYSCRKGKGTGLARERCKRHVRSGKYVLKMDVSKYFPSIDHQILKDKIRRLIKCSHTLDLIDRIIDSWKTDEHASVWFDGDDLICPLERPRGLPIGSLTSQLFANLYLSRIDHLIEEQLKSDGYLRYTDDLLLFSNDKEILRISKEILMDEFSKERLSPHPTKCRIHVCKEGVPFLGFRFYPDKVRIIRKNRLRFERRINRMRGLYHKRLIEAKDIWKSMFGWFQFAREQAGSEGLVIAECAHHVF